MTLTLTLTPDLEVALMQQASDLGTTPEQLALESLRKQLAETLTAPRNLAELLEDQIGGLDRGVPLPGEARMLEETGKTFVDILLEKQEQERKRWREIP